MWTDELNGIHQSSFDQALSSFIVKSAKIVCKNLVEPYNEDLVKKLNRMFARFKDDNEKYRVFGSKFIS